MSIHATFFITLLLYYFINALYCLYSVLRGGRGRHWCLIPCLLERSCRGSSPRDTYGRGMEGVGYLILPPLAGIPESELQSLDGHSIRQQGLCIFAFDSKADRSLVC